MNSTLEAEIEVPIWWNKVFVQAQSQPITLYQGTTGLVIPYCESDTAIEVGLVGPYGAAFPTTGNSLSPRDYFLEWESFLSQFSKKTCIVRIPPESHFGEVSTLNSLALHKLGFQLQFQDVNQTIGLENYWNNINRNRRRDLDRARREGLTFGEETLEAAHETIRRNRASRGFPLTMSQADLSRLSGALPSTIFCHSVRLQGSVQASSICFRVSRDLAYVFMWGHNIEGALPGPSMSLLAVELMRALAGAGFHHLCLGTSSIQGTVNEGLLNFKASLGAYSEIKKTYFLS